MTYEDILEKTAHFLHIQVTDILAHRMDYQERVIVVVAGAGQKYTVPFDELGLHDDQVKREAVKAVRETTTLPGPPDPPISPIQLQPLFILLEPHISQAAIQLLREAGYQSGPELREASDEDLLAIPGIGPRTLAIIREIQDQAI